MNCISFTGNLGKAAKQSQTSGGTTVLSFGVAVKSGYGDNEKTTWVQCRIFGKRAEGKLVQYLGTGSRVAVTGDFALDEWQDQQGQKKALISCVVSQIDLIGNNEPQEQQPAFQQPSQPQPMQSGNTISPTYSADSKSGALDRPVGFDDFDDDIPF